MKQPNLRGRYLSAMSRLRKLAPVIYTAEHVQAQLRALPRLNDSELLYFVLSAESQVRRKEKKAETAP